MDISLVAVTKKNYEAICDLDVTEEQEDFVACNMWSLVESFYNDGHTTRAICRGEEVVGFFMWVSESETMTSIWRFMIDKKFQHQGIGRQALHLALKEIEQTPNIRQIEICYNPNNPVAKDFYSSFGFVETGMDEDGEDMIAVINMPKQGM